jgi:membrane protease YdiL (CAAX protease family)
VTVDSIRACLAIVASVLVFALLIERGGLIPAVMLTVLVASQASRKLRRRDALLLAIGLAAVVSLIFVGLLAQPFALIRGF